MAANCVAQNTKAHNKRLLSVFARYSLIANPLIISSRRYLKSLFISSRSTTNFLVSVPCLISLLPFIKPYLKKQFAKIKRIIVIQKPNINLIMSFFEVAISAFTKSFVAISGRWSCTSYCINDLLYPTRSSASFSPNFFLRELKSCISMSKIYAFQIKK